MIGGPVGDAGLTGRKIIVDTYGGMARHGGGAFSGKDPSKVDRSAAYAARWVAKNVVAAGLADRCEVQVAYAIGVAHPVSVMVETFGTEKIGRGRSPRSSTSTSTCAPASFREQLRLHRPIYQKTAAYGHFGRDDPTSPGSGPIAPTRCARPPGSAPSRSAAPRTTPAGSSASRPGVPGADLRRRRRHVVTESDGAAAVGRVVDHVDDLGGVGDAGEDEVVVVAGGGVEVDVADLEHALDHRLVVVDVLDPLEPRLLDRPRDDPALDVQAAVGDRVAGRDPLDEADEDRQRDADQGDDRDEAAVGPPSPRPLMKATIRAITRVSAMPLM